MRFRGSLLKVEVSKGQARFVLEEGDSIRFFISGKEVMIHEKGGEYIEKI